MQHEDDYGGSGWPVESVEVFVDRVLGGTCGGCGGGGLDGPDDDGPDDDEPVSVAVRAGRKPVLRVAAPGPVTIAVIAAEAGVGVPEVVRVLGLGWVDPGSPLDAMTAEFVRGTLAFTAGLTADLVRVPGSGAGAGLHVVGE